MVTMLPSVHIMSSSLVFVLSPCQWWVQCCAVLCCAVLCCAVLCCAVLCCRAPFLLAYVCYCAALCFAATQQCSAVLCCATMFVPATVHLTSCLIQEASRGLGQQLRSSFALPSSSSPPKLYQRSPHLVQIYGDDSEEEEDEADEAVR